MAVGVSGAAKAEPARATVFEEQDGWGLWGWTVRQGLGTREQGSGGVVLPKVWAVGDVARGRVGGGGTHRARCRAMNGAPKAVAERSERHPTLRDKAAKDGPPAVVDGPRRLLGDSGERHPTLLQRARKDGPAVEVGFYRRYTEAMVRRFGVLAMEAGRVPSLVGREMFRAKVTNYRVQSFEDVVIFCLDIEKCLKRLSPGEQALIKRVTLQQYTLQETAVMLGMSLRNCIRQYLKAVDRLTKVLLEARLIEPLKSCQEGKAAANLASEAMQEVTDAK